MDEFIRILERLRGQGWHLKSDGAILNENGMCPGLAVSVALQHGGTMLPRGAPLFIVASADNLTHSPNFDAGLRRRMLGALGLAEAP